MNWRSATKLAATLGLLAFLAAMLLSGTLQILAISGIVLVVAWFVDVFRFAVDPRERTITIRRLWWGLLERRSTTYSFEDVYSLRKKTLGDGMPAYRWEFQDGATYYLPAPIDARLIQLFPARGNKTREAFERRLLLFALSAVFLVWTTVTLYFDVVVGCDIIQQVRARSYPHVAGRILKSTIKLCQSGSDGTGLWDYEPDVQFSFTVNGIEYTGNRYRYSRRRTWKFSESAARALLPKGEEVAVYYNPRDPADAILSPGVSGPDVFLLLCLLPFNVVVLIGTIGCVQLVRSRVTYGMAVWGNGRVVRAGVHRWSPAAGASLAAGAVAFILIFAIGVPTGGNPSVLIASLGWLIVLAAAGLAWQASVRALATGTRDLVINREDRTLTLPVTWARKEPLTIPWESLSSIEVEDTPDDSETRHYAVVAVLTHADGTTTRERLTEPQTEPEANALAAWVRGLLHS